MSPEEPSFSSKPLAETNDQEPKPRRSKPRTAKKIETNSNKQTKLSQQLTQIYQDNEGRLPDMRKIKIKKSHSGLKNFFIVIFVGALLAAAAWAGFFLMPNNKKFSADQIALNISGPKNVMSGTAASYKIIYENNQSVPLKQATLNIQYPDGFVFISSDVAAKNPGHTEWQLNDTGAHKKKEINITGLTYGSLNQKKSWRAFLTYQPENFNSQLQQAAFLDINIDKSPFSLAITGPSKTITGNGAEYIFTIKKEQQSEISKLELKPVWPQNFFITSSSPALNKDNKWIIEPNKTSSSTSVGADSWTFKLSGKFSSSTLAAGDISASLSTVNNGNYFSLADAKTTTELTQNDIDFNLAINGSLVNFNDQPGDNLNMTLSLKNQSPQDLKNAILKITLDAPAIKKQSLLNWAKIEDKLDGDVHGTQINDNLRRGEIVWDKTKLPELAKLGKNQTVSIDVQLPIKDAQSFNSADASTGAKITAVAEISFKDGDNITHVYSSNQIVITVNSDLKFETRDSVSGSNNEKHKISWILTNSFHPLKNLTISADVYGDAAVEIPSSTSAGSAIFDRTSKKITWTIPEMPESVDTLALPITITLNKVNPTQKMLISKAHVQAEDSISGEKLDFLGDETNLNQ
ncbi:MAG TPA: hypothetical protein VLK22_02885 [Candidatus Udaeobacter sp.]|nr:hypothetical protein [Candidatus Udaeobacter sp.]